MRIIAGAAKGRKLCTPESGTHKTPIRPTADRAREALFSILGSCVDGAVVLDLFAGTGALGLEALSRGAKHAVLVDNYQKALNLIHRNVDLCGFSELATVLKRDISKGLFFLKKAASYNDFDLVFIDPPYGKKLGNHVLQELGSSPFLQRDGIVVVEDYYKESFLEEIGSLQLFEQRRYGETSFWFYRAEMNT